jgi:ribosome biogenesis GTPase
LTRRSEKAPRPAHTAEGQVVASFGRRHLVELERGTTLECVTRGRRRDVACGDRVRVSVSGEGQGVVEAIDPRSTLLYRSDARREKVVCANATRVVIVVAAVPPFSHDLLNRCLIAAEHGGMSAVLALNKADLPETAAARASLENYARLGYRVVTFSAKRDLAPLAPHLEGETSVLVGQSGMGKSTIVNRLVPGAAARVAEISAAHHSGRHTTTHTRLHRLEAGGAIIDSPGMQAFGLHHLDWRDAAQAFPEFRPWLGHCRFRDCRHIVEPGCALEEAARAGTIAAARLASYRRLAAELAQPVNAARRN